MMRGDPSTSGQAVLENKRGMAVEEVNLQHGQGGRLRGKRRRSATDMGVEKAAPGRPTDQVALL